MCNICHHVIIRPKIWPFIKSCYWSLASDQLIWLHSIAISNYFLSASIVVNLSMSCYPFRMKINETLFSRYEEIHSCLYASLFMSTQLHILQNVYIRFKNDNVKTGFSIMKYKFKLPWMMNQYEILFQSIQGVR